MTFRSHLIATACSAFLAIAMPQVSKADELTAGQKGEAQRWYALALAGFDRLLIRGGSRTTSLLYARSFCAAKLGRIDEAFGNIREAMHLNQTQSDLLLRLPQLSSSTSRERRIGVLRRRRPE